MFLKLKNLIDKELVRFIDKADKTYSLSHISPLLFNTIKDFVLRDGKRLRPILFVIGYQGFANKPATNLYKSAISIELLHAFLLVHDDIIDKSATRRGKPSMHKMLDTYLQKYKHRKFSGQDLAIVAADIIYAMSIEAFLTIKEDAAQKEAALKKLIEATIYTGSGEFIELLLSLKKLNNISKSDIYKVYDYKTAYYTFASPLAIGAILAGAGKNQITKLINYGIYLGRAFQINDDILGMFSAESKTGKSSFTD
ncbi:MAG: polyprenyl synthetase family protein, partial [Candidatus Omnitrophica bacterium]|nr:polyprenyl synthetase family protein [Candidatus Omnitrophota bacterium]